MTASRAGRGLCGGRLFRAARINSSLCCASALPDLPATRASPRISAAAPATSRSASRVRTRAGRSMRVDGSQAMLDAGRAAPRPRTPVVAHRASPAAAAGDAPRAATLRSRVLQQPATPPRRPVGAVGRPSSRGRGPGRRLRHGSAPPRNVATMRESSSTSMPLASPTVLKTDFYNSLLAAYRPDEVRSQLADVPASENLASRSFPTATGSPGAGFRPPKKKQKVSCSE